MTQQIKGTLALLILTMLYGFYGVYNRMIGESFGTFSQNWVRNLIVVVVLTMYFIVGRKKLIKIKQKDMPWVIVWLLSGSAIMILLFLAFNNLPLGTVYFLFYSTMITSGFISGMIFFKEKLNLIKVTSITLALVGLTLIYSLAIKPNEIVYVLFALLSGLILGFWNTISKKFSDNYPNLQIVFMDGLASVIVSLLGAFIVKESMPQFTFTSGWVWITLYALTQIASVGLLVYGFKNLEAQIGSIIMPVEVIFATIFGMLVFHEIPTVTTLIGGLLIASASFLPNIQVFLESRRTKES